MDQYVRKILLKSSIQEHQIISREIKNRGIRLTFSCRYAFDVLGELFYGKVFGVMNERTDVGNYMRAIDSLTIGDTFTLLPEYTVPCIYNTVLATIRPWSYQAYKKCL